MKRSTLVSVMAAGLALTTASGAFAAATGVLNPTPNRESKLIADFEGTTDVTGDPTGTGTNITSINTDNQFVAEGSKSLKVDMTGVTGGGLDHEFTINFSPPIDIKGYLMLAMDIFIPEDSIEASWYQFQPRTTTTDPNDDTKTILTTYINRDNMHSGWNHLVWDLKEGTDTKLVQLDMHGNSGADYHGPLYVDNIRVYKGKFVGLQPDEKLIFGFDKATDKDFFTVGSAANGVDIDTDKQFISQGEGSLAIDMTDQSSGWTSDIASVDDWGTTLDASNATALHLDFFVPIDSAPAEGDNGWHQLGFQVIGDGGTVAGDNNSGVVDGQWNTLEIPLTAEQAAMLKNVKGIRFLRNSGDTWRGKIYVDALRAVVPTPPATGGTAGGTTAGP